MLIPLNRLSKNPIQVAARNLLIAPQGVHLDRSVSQRSTVHQRLSGGQVFSYGYFLARHHRAVLQRPDPRLKEHWGVGTSTQPNQTPDPN